ncbi:MAG: TIM barrel protein [Rhodopirellula sp.]|nr:TIM barrel protein [Rhodopirellula sp.]
MNVRLVGFAIWGALLAGCLVAPPKDSRADEPTRRAGIQNPLFAMNFALHDPQLATRPDAQARLLKETGYAGTQFLGTLEQLEGTLTAMERAGLEVFTAAVTPYNIPVDPGKTYPAILKDAIRKLEGRKTLLLIQFVSERYERSSPEGDARAVELGRELADYAKCYKVRLAIYHHVHIWCERADHAARIAEQCGRDNLGICVNLFHWLKTDPEGDLPVLAKSVLPVVFLVTVNGTSPEGNYQTLDQGSEAAERFLRPFLQAGYRGPIGLQCVTLKGDPRNNLVVSMEAWKGMSARLAGSAPAAD